MKFETTTGEITTTIKNAISCATGGKPDYPDANSVTLIVSKGTLTLQANNGSSAITYSVPVTVETEGKATVKAKEIMDSLSSFKKDEVLVFSITKTHFVISQKSDMEQEQTMPLAPKDVQMPNIASDFGKTVNLKREVLANCIDKVSFAIGIERLRPEFHQWVLRFYPNRVRAVCGDGSRFASYELEGANIVEAEKPFSILVHRDHNDVLLKTVTTATSDFVTIREHAAKDDEDAISNQICVSFDSTTLILFGHDPGAKWPNEDKFLTRKSPCRYVFDTDGEFNLIYKGIQATNNDDVRRQSAVHSTSLTPDLSKSILNLVAEHAMTSKRKLKIVNMDIPSSFAFSCQSSFLGDIARNAEGNVQVEMLDEKQPAVVRFFAGDKVADAPIYRVNDTNGTKEQYTIFFTAYNKKK